MKRIALAVLLFACATAHAQNWLGHVIDAGTKAYQSDALKDFTPEQEAALGEALMSGFLGASPLHSDASLQRYVNRVGKWCALHSDRPDLQWTFAVIDTETINAFAMPGGYVVVSSGLLKRLSNESELAGVLSHEIAHVVKGHQAAAIKAEIRSNIAKGAAADIAGDKFARQGGGYAVQELKNWGAGIALEMFKNGALLRPLDRSMEYDADRLGVVIATRAGYDAYGLVGALEMLAQIKGGGDAASVFATHPPANERIGELEKFMPTVEGHPGQQLDGRFKQVVGAAK